MVDVLIADDDPSDRAVIKRALKRLQPTLRTAEVDDGAQAVDYLLRQGEYAGLSDRDMPRLVFLDCKMPFLTGIEVLQQIKPQDGFDKVPMLMLSSSDNDKDRIAALDAGAGDFLRKPAQYEEYMSMIQRTAGKWLGISNQIKNSE